MSPFELFDNIFQLIVSFSFSIITIIAYIHNPKFAPFRIFAGSLITWFSGTCFWTIYFVIFGDFPYYFSASEICYMCLYLFMIAICNIFFKKTNPALTNKTKIYSLILPLFVIVANLISYLLIGGLIWILYYTIPLTILAYKVNINLFIIKSKDILKFHIVLCAFIVITNIMYIVSSFGWNDMYICFDILLTLTIPSMFYFLKKECYND